MTRAITPRLFWRRAFALIIDLAIATALFVAALIALQPVFPDQIVFDAPIGIRQCAEIEETDKLRDYARQLDPSLELPRTYIWCKESFFGVLEYQKLAVHVTTAEEEGVKHTNGLTLFVDENLDQFTPFDFGTLFTFAIPLFMAMSTYWAGVTPGKKLLGLRLATPSPRPSFKQLLWREILRFAPFVFWGALQLIFLILFTIFSPTEIIAWTFGLIDNPFYWGLYFLVHTLSMLYYLVPMVRWRGSMLYDKWAHIEGVRRA